MMAKQPEEPRNVMVLDVDGVPLLPCTARRATDLVAKGSAVIAQSSPLKIRLRRPVAEDTPPSDLSRRKRRRINPLIRRLLARDGDGCFYCGKALGEDHSFEHLLSDTDGGPFNLANLALAHSACNHLAGNLAVAQKVALRDHMRSATSRPAAAG